MAKVSPIPHGCERVIPHLVVKNATEAISFYQKAFGAEETVCMRGPGGGIMHAEIRIGQSLVFLNDEFPAMGCRAPTTLGGTPIVLTFYVENVDALFDRAVAAGAKPTMPLMNMFWGDRYGQVTDPFGHIWALASHLEDLTPQEMAKRGEEAMKMFKK